MAQRVCERGIIEEEVNGRLSECLRQSVDYENEKARKLLYGENVFVFVSDNGLLKLITVYQMSVAFKERAIRAQRRLRKTGG